MVILLSIINIQFSLCRCYAVVCTTVILCLYIFCCILVNVFANVMYGFLVLYSISFTGLYPLYEFVHVIAVCNRILIVLC